MKRDAIVLVGNPDPATISWIKENYSEEDTRIYAFDVNVPDELSYFKIIDYSIDENSKRTINKEIFETILEFGDHRINQKFSNVHMLNYQFFNIWYYNKFRIFYWLRDAAYCDRILNDLSIKFSKVLLVSNREFYGYLAERENVELRNYGAKRKYSGETFRLVVFYLRRFFLHFLRSDNPVNKYLIISPKERLTRMLDPKDLSPQVNDPFFGYLTNKYGSEFTILDEFNLNLSSNDFKLPYHKSFVYGEAIIVKAFFNLRTFREWTIMKKKFKRILFNLYDKSVRKKDKVILRYLISRKGSHNYYLFRYLAYRNFFRKKKPKAILAADENSMFIKVILDAAKYSNHLTIGMQHGNIHELHPAYIFTKNDLELHPMPDYTLLWGNRWKKVLTGKSCYSEDELVVVGQLRTDIIPRLQQKGKQGEFTIVFASQPQLDQELRERAAADIFKMAVELKVRLRLKLHPREKNKDYYRNIAKSVGFESLEFTGDEDLYEVILNADLVITCYSTVGAETAYFYKPLIILDYLNEDVNGYAADGIAFQAQNYNELKDFSKKISSGELGIDRNVHQKYISECAYKIDGKVSSRIMAWLRDLHPITSHNVE